MNNLVPINNLNNISSNLGSVVTRASSPVTNFVKSATSLFAPNKAINNPSLNYKIDNLQPKRSPIVQNFINTAQKHIQNWATKNPARAQNIINAPSQLTQAITEPIASIPFKMSASSIKTQKANMVPVSYKKMNKQGQVWDKKINSLSPEQRNPVANLIWGEADYPNPISGSSANLPAESYNTDKSNPELEAIKQKILAGENVRPSARDYLSDVPIEYAKLFAAPGQPTPAGIAPDALKPNRRILINEDIAKPQKIETAPGVFRQETPPETAQRVDFQLNDTIKHELLHQTPDLVPLKSFKPENKQIIKEYVNRWSKEYFTNPETQQFDTKRLVGEMFAEQQLPSAYYWHIYKQVVPDAKPSTFLQTIKSYFVNNINTKENSVIPSTQGGVPGISVPGTGGGPVLNQ